MSIEADILTRLSEMTNEEINSYKIYSKVGTASSINATARTCTFTPLDGGAVIENIRLQGALNLSEGLLILPVNGSTVIVTFINNLTGFVSLTTQVDKININTQGKIHFEGNSTDLKTDILNDLIDKLKNAIITTPSGPGAFAPATITAFTNIDTKINTLFE